MSLEKIIYEGKNNLSQKTNQDDSINNDVKEKEINISENLTNIKD